MTDPQPIEIEAAQVEQLIHEIFESFTVFTLLPQYLCIDGKPLTIRLR